MHDDLQLPGGKLSNDLCGAAYRADQFVGRDRYSASEQYHDRKPIVSEQLLVTAACMSDELRADIALAVISRFEGLSAGIVVLTSPLPRDYLR